MQHLMGNKPEQIPRNGDLGRLAFQNPEAVVLEPQASATPQKPGDMVFQLTTDTTLLVKVRGLDGTVRSVSLTLA